MSHAIDSAREEAERAISTTAEKMNQLDIFELLALIDAAYDTIQRQEIDHEIQVPTSGEVMCPACGQPLTTIMEIERESEPVSEAQFDVERRMVSDAAAPAYTDNVAWITPCCATRVSLSPEWNFDTIY